MADSRRSMASAAKARRNAAAEGDVETISEELETEVVWMMLIKARRNGVCTSAGVCRAFKTRSVTQFHANKKCIPESIMKHRGRIASASIVRSIS